MSLLSPPTLYDSPRWASMRIGLLGGSFNPPHEGHVHISLSAMKSLKLDAVWWLVTPQNPLKNEQPVSMKERIKLCRELITHPGILVSDIERKFGTNITYETIRALKKHYPKTEFAWISGMDNAHSLHQWQRWQDLLDEVCMVHLSRKTSRSLVQNCPNRMYKKQKHIFLRKSGALPLDSGITYWMMQKKMINISSTEIRKNTSKTVA